RRSLSPHDREAVLLAEALHALADCWRRCHHKNEKLFLFAEASLVLWWQRLYTRSSSCQEVWLLLQVTATANHREPRQETKAPGGLPWQ
ncbi:MAG: hypothetical protein WC871_08850, partial [Bacteroidales bacterium]